MHVHVSWIHLSCFTELEDCQLRNIDLNFELFVQSPCFICTLYDQLQCGSYMYMFSTV